MSDPLKYDFDPKKQYRRLMFTINNPTFKDSETLWNLGHDEKHCKYLIYGAEHTEEGQGTPHFQGFLILKNPQRISTIMKWLGGRAHPTRIQEGDPSARCANYCRKEGFYMQFGELGGGANPQLKPAELRQLAIEWLDNEDNKYVRMKDIPAHFLMTPGFLTAWEAKRKTLLGPDREVRVITVIGPTACGKSYAAHNLFPDHAKWIPGNGGAWFSNGDAPVLLFEEFNGQIDLQKMLTLLDHYPLQLEYKGSMSPALFTTVVITSNVSPDHWYGNWLRQAKAQEEARMRGIDPEEAERKWNEAKKALFDRIGFRSNRRGSGFYMEWAHTAPPENEAARYLECLTMRQEIWTWMEHAATVDIHNTDEQQMQEERQQDQAELNAVEALQDIAEAAAAQPPYQMRRMDAEPDLADWQSRIDALFN